RRSSDLVVAHEYGRPEVLKFEEVPRPEPKENEALVRVIASGVNPADPLTLSGKYAREFGTHLPLIPGYDIAGIVEKTGIKVTKLKVGDAIYGYPTFGGGWAGYVTVTEGEVAAKPASLSFTEAAAVPMGALTAWQALVDVAQLRAGQTILIHGGSGGVVMSLVARPDPVELEKRGIRGAAISVHPDAEDLAEIAHLIDAEKIKPIVTQVLPLSEAIAAQRQAATHHTRGKVVLRIGDEPKS